VLANQAWLWGSPGFSSKTHRRITFAIAGFLIDKLDYNRLETLAETGSRPLNEPPRV